MNGRVAKQVRKLIFGDYSYKVRKYIRDVNGTIREISLRHKYQQIKRQMQRRNLG